MFSRCPECLTVYTLKAPLLARAQGLALCGNCRRVFNTLENLFDYWPESDSKPAARLDHSSPPELGSTTAAVQHTGGGQNVSVESSSRDGSRKWWVSLLVSLVVLTLVNLAWTFRLPLLESSAVRHWLSRLDLVEEDPVIPFRDLSLIHLVSRDLHQHPTRTGMLALSVVFVNRASQTQAFPGIRLSLMNSAGDIIASRSFLPPEYLPEIQDRTAGMQPNVHFPILMEFMDPGSGTTGFELDFE